MAKDLTLKIYMDDIRSCSGENDDIVADRILMDATRTKLFFLLANGRRVGRHGWWNPKVTSIEELQHLVDKSHKERKWCKLALYSMMLAIRESEE